MAKKGRISKLAKKRLARIEAAKARGSRGPFKRKKGSREEAEQELGLFRGGTRKRK